MTKDLYHLAEIKIDEIENELKRLGYWSPNPPDPERMKFKKAFAFDTLAFSEWLQFVLIPNVRKIIREHGEFPTQSMVAAQAVREFDDDLDRVRTLVDLLAEFDDLFEESLDFEPTNKN